MPERASSAKVSARTTERTSGRICCRRLFRKDQGSRPEVTFHLAAGHNNSSLAQWQLMLPEVNGICLNRMVPITVLLKFRFASCKRLTASFNFLILQCLISLLSWFFFPGSNILCLDTCVCFLNINFRYLRSSLDHF